MKTLQEEINEAPFDICQASEIKTIMRVSKFKSVSGKIRNESYRVNPKETTLGEIRTLRRKIAEELQHEFPDYNLKYRDIDIAMKNPQGLFIESIGFQFHVNHRDKEVDIYQSFD